MAGGILDGLNAAQREAVTHEGGEISRAQCLQAEAARVEQAKQDFTLKKENLDFNGQVRFSGALTYGVIGGTADKPEETVYALDLTGAAIPVDGGWTAQ